MKHDDCAAYELSMCIPLPAAPVPKELTSEEKLAKARADAEAMHQMGSDAYARGNPRLGDDFHRHAREILANAGVYPKW